jgi:hypothetical protein
MTNFQLYVRILTELSILHQGRSAGEARVRLQDVLCELRDRSAAERGDDPAAEATHNDAEHEAMMAVLTPDQKEALKRDGSIRIGNTLVFHGGA